MQTLKNNYPTLIFDLGGGYLPEDRGIGLIYHRIDGGSFPPSTPAHIDLVGTTCQELRPRHVNAAAVEVVEGVGDPLHMSP